jgi:menaquinol-cytochrome c reductase iron-sulfur subunit
MGFMPNEQPTRRGFLGFLTTALMTCLGIILAVPAIGYIWSPLRKKAGEENAGDGFSDAGPVGDLPVGKWQRVSIEVVRQDGWEKTRTGRGVYVRRSDEGSKDIRVLSPICPHLGCSISWQSESDQFMCPCHKAVFNTNGTLISGPPPREMDALESEIRGGRLWVRWQDFKIGVPDRISVEV